MPGGYGEFELDIERVLKEQLCPFFDNIQKAPLTIENIEAIPAQAKGAYILFEGDVPVYAGKTDVRHGFRARLLRHYYCIQHRENLDPGAVSFKATRVMVFSNFDVEAILIKELQRDEGALSWNFSGFGSNDPGHNREGQEPAAFDVEHPVDVHRNLDFIEEGEQGVLDLLIKMKLRLPYLIRYETDLVPARTPGKFRYVDFRQGHAEQRGINVNVTDTSVFAIMQAIVNCLPAEDWQATIFPDRVILYKEHHNYRYARYIIRRNEVIEL